MATSLMDDHDSELNRLRIVIDNYASDGATVIRVENLRGRLGDFVRTISDLGLVIHDCRFRYHSSRLWHSVWVFNVTDDNGNKIAYERAISDIQTAIEEMERRHLTRMNAPPLELDESYLYMLDPWSFGHAAPIMRQCDLPSIIASLRDVFKKTGLNIFDAQSHDPAEPIMERRENPLVLPDSKWFGSPPSQTGHKIK